MEKIKGFEITEIECEDKITSIVHFQQIKNTIYVLTNEGKMYAMKQKKWWEFWKR